MSGDKMYMSSSNPYENNFCTPDLTDYKAKRRAKSRLFTFSNKSYYEFYCCVMYSGVEYVVCCYSECISHTRQAEKSA